MKKIKSVMIKFCIVCSSILLTLLAMEIIFKLLGIGSIDNMNIINLNEDARLLPSNNPKLIYTFKPNIPGMTNSIGIHDKEYAIKNEASIKRIVALGDSVAWGVGDIPMDKNFLALLEDYVNGVEIINLSHSGYNTVQEIEVLKQKGLQFKPDSVWLFYVLNDPFHDSNEIYKLGMDQLARNQVKTLSFWTWIRRHSNVWQFIEYRYLSIQVRLKIHKMIKNDIANYMQKNNMTNFYHYVHIDKYFLKTLSCFKELKHLSKQYNFKLTVFIIPLLTDFQNYENKNVHKKIFDSLTSLDIKVVDMLPLLQNLKAEELRRVPRDKMHLNMKGHLTFSKCLLPFLQKEFDLHE